MKAANFLSELKRRNVLRAAAFYAASAWLLVQVATQVFPFFHIAEWVVRWIVIAASIGFPFAMAFSWFYEWTPQGLQREGEIAPSESIARQTGRKLDRWIIALLTLAVVLLLTNQFVLRRDENSATAASVTNNSIPFQSVAVLPLTNESGDSNEKYFSDGLSEDLITALSQVGGLKVIGRMSSFRFRDTKEDSAAIGAKLGVAHLLEGSVRRTENVVRIVAELVNAIDGTTLWSQRYDRPYQDLFKLQDEITQAVASALKAKLLDNTATPARSDRPPSGNLEAYNALLQGKFYSDRRTTEDLRKGISYYEEAIRLDPRYALAYAHLTLAMEYLVSNLGGFADKGREEAIAKARAAAESALRLDPNLAQAHLAKGIVLQNLDFDFAGAEVETRSALELAPQNQGATVHLAALLSMLGRLDEAIAIDQRAITRDPLVGVNYLNFAIRLTAVGRYDEAEGALHKAIELQPQATQNYLRLAIIQILRDNPASAVTFARQEIHPVWRTYALALACFANGDRAEADAHLKKLVDENADDAGSQIAEVYALRKEPDKVFEWLDHAWTTHDPGVNELLYDPFLRTYKDDPRFIAFAQKIGVTRKTAANPSTPSPLSSPN